MEIGWTNALCGRALVKYFVDVEGETFEVDVTHDEVRIDGELVDISLEQSGIPELFSVLIDSQSHEVLIQSAGGGVNAVLSGYSFQLSVQDEAERRLQVGRQTEVAPDGELHLAAPISGLIVSVPVAVGDEVMQGQNVVVLEAMKMENEISAPRAGRIKSVLVEAGERVEVDATMIVLE